MFLLQKIFKKEKENGKRKEKEKKKKTSPFFQREKAQV